jgi:hypothetical protein
LLGGGSAFAAYVMRFGKFRIAALLVQAGIIPYTEIPPDGWADFLGP